MDPKKKEMLVRLRMRPNDPPKTHAVASSSFSLNGNQMIGSLSFGISGILFFFPGVECK